MPSTRGSQSEISGTKVTSIRKPSLVATANRIGAALRFPPTRIYGQDSLAKVMMVDMAGLRDALAEAGKDPARVNPAVPVDIIIDHSLQVDAFGTREAPRLDLAMECKRNAERFAFLRWCSQSFANLRVGPPGKNDGCGSS
jgi:aconitate hydratase